MPDARLPLFAYGTLMAPAIIGRVIGRVPASEPAHVFGFQRFTVHDRNFPGLIRSQNPADRVDGLLYFDIIPREWKFLTDYEDDFYVLEPIPVQTSSQIRDALAYLIPPEAAHLLSPHPWNLTHFSQHHLPTYLA